MKAFSLHRTLAIFLKEFHQMLRDRLTFAMAIGVPVLQLVLFGYAINTDPKGLPTAVVAYDRGPMSRSLVAALQNTGYFRVTHLAASEAEAESLLESGEVQFMVAIPPDFTLRLVRGEQPALLVAVDATRRPRATRSRRWSRWPSRRCAPTSSGRSRTCGAAPRPTRCGCTVATTPRGCRATTSCRA
jgi:ABC-type Na+ efflux pump permease subunit